MWASDGGSLTNQGIHFIDLARYLCGDIKDVSFRIKRKTVIFYTKQKMAEY